MAASHAFGEVGAKEFYRNLVLLGFEASSEAAWAKTQASGHGTIGESMFDTLSSNETGLLAILHFLFAKINGPVATRRDFSTCFPVTDNTQRREFKNKARAALAALESSGVVPVGTARGSTLNMAKGKPAQILVWILSIAAIRKDTQRMEKQCSDLKSQSQKPLPVLSSETATVTSNVQMWEDAAKQEALMFRETSNRILNSSNEQSSYLEELSMEHGKLQKELEKLDAKLTQEAEALKEGSIKSFEDSGQRDQISEARTFLAELSAFPAIGRLEADLELLSAPNSSISKPISLHDGATSPSSVISTTVAAHVTALEHAKRTAKGTSSVLHKEQLLQCLAKIDRVRRDVGALSAKLGNSLNSLNETRATHSDTLLGMR
mmetsp:Transcript_3097/g.5223  ORF Transcript_3097/g.5223 Transcript_3097/m.5223 type:complete len:378 (+) Transcript_3097:261-1394(+)